MEPGCWRNRMLCKWNEFPAGPVRVLRMLLDLQPEISSRPAVMRYSSSFCFYRAQLPPWISNSTFTRYFPELPLAVSPSTRIIRLICGYEYVALGRRGRGAFTIIKSKLTAIGGTNKGVVVQSIGFLTKELPFPILASSLFSPSILRNRLSSCFGVRVFFLHSYDLKFLRIGMKE